MSISSEITRITGNIADAYTAVSGKGGTLPSAQNSANLPAAIESIPEFVLTTKTISANGTYAARADNANGYSQVTVAIPVYDGTVV